LDAIGLEEEEEVRWVGDRGEREEAISGDSWPVNIDPCNDCLCVVSIFWNGGCE